ncbi:MAG TPA: alpha/beta family hydrolase [Acidimicrobiales bacterium]|jgi:predicted alpha/beta-hydrolase family hydrolase
MKPGALLLAPGAGSNRENPSLKAIEQAVAPMPVARMDFPYRKAGRSGPDRPPVLLAAVHEEAAALVQAAHIRANRLALGGRSMGGRICSMAVADGLAAAALVLISYPLHPPGKPDNLRVEHLTRLTVPCLFISGTRDPFGAPEELLTWTATIPGPVTHEWIDGGRHELKGADARIASTVAGWLRGLR